MKRFTLIFSAVLMFVLIGIRVNAQQPPAIMITPEDATAFDELTLTLDAKLSCPDSALFGAGVVKMHSGVTLDGATWQNVVAFDGLGLNGQSTDLIPVMGALPLAISMTPRYATVNDSITLTLDAKKSCPDSALFNADSVMMHSGITIDGAAWSNVVEFNGTGANGVKPKFTDNGDSTWSFTYVPADFYGVTTGVVTAINCVFNAGDWALGEGKDFNPDGSGSCVDFLIPLATEYQHTWSITFTPADFYGIAAGTYVPAINCVFNAGDWALGEGKDFNPDGSGSCVDFIVSLQPFGIGENQANDAVRFYPNPVNDQLTIEILKPANRIEIYNMIGELVESVENISSPEIIVNTENYAPGIYFISVDNQGNTSSTKFLKN